MSARRPDLAELADLDAGLLEPARATQVRAAAAADPGSAAALEALAATRAELAALPDPPVPAEIAARWSAALEAEAVIGGSPPAAEADSSDSPAHRRVEARVLSRVRRPRPPRKAARASARQSWRRPRAAAGVTALLAALVLAGVLWPRPGPALSLDEVNLAAAARAAVGSIDAGGLADPARRAGCLRTAAPALPPNAPLIGGRTVTLGGRHAVLLVLATGQLGTFQVVVVDPECGPGRGTLLYSTVVGR